MTNPDHSRPGVRRGRPSPRPRIAGARACPRCTVRARPDFAAYRGGREVAPDGAEGERRLAARRESLEVDVSSEALAAAETAAGGPFSPEELLVLFAVAAGGEADADPFTLARLSAETGLFRSELVMAAMGLVGRGIITETRTRDALGEPVTSLHLAPAQLLALPASVMVGAIRTCEEARSLEAAR